MTTQTTIRYAVDGPTGYIGIEARRDGSHWTLTALAAGQEHIGRFVLTGQPFRSEAEALAYVTAMPTAPCHERESAPAFWSEYR